MSIKLFDETSIAMSRRLALNYSTSFSLGIRLLSKECRWAIFSIYGLDCLPGSAGLPGNHLKGLIGQDF